MTKIAIIYYSTYGHLAKMAEAIKEGVEQATGVTAEIYQIAETLPEEVLAKMHAPPKKDHPIATPDVLKAADGILFGFPTRFGSMPAQVKALFDSTGGLWSTGGLVGKPAGFFFSTGTQGGGQETTAFTAVTFLTHQGLTFVPLGYRSPLLFSFDEIHGGSPWGAGTYAGPDGSRQPTELELNVAKVQGESFAQVAKKLSAASDGGIVDPTSSFVPLEAMELFNRVGYSVVGVAVLLAAFLFVRKFMFYLTWRSFRDGPYAIGLHQWRPGNLAGPQWCNICESIVYGIRSYVVTCDICGMYAHAQCAATTVKYKGVPETSGACACKAAAVGSPAQAQQPQRHLWIKGNIDPMDTCSICGLFCGSILALSGMKCAWCHIRVHENCFQTHAKSHRHHFLRQCDFGRHRNLILPPSAVILNEAPSFSSKSQRALSSVRSAAQIAVNKMSNIRLRRSTITSSSSLNGLHSEPPGSPRTSSETGSSSVGSSPSSPQPPLSMPMMPLLERLDSNGAPTTTTATTTTLSSDLPFEIVAPQDITPLLVFINSRSGGQMGLYVLRQIRKWLNPIQVYDLSHQSPVAPLLQFKDIPRLRILVCGGDGTVGWVLSALDEIGGPRQPPIAILPLGTGNDLARVLGWGSGFSTRDVSDILMEIAAAHVSLLDRWQVNIDGKKRVVLNNYLGVGVDAQVALEFHEQRERSPGLFMSQFVNKLWYSQFGAKNFLMRTCAGLPTKMELECDGKVISLPPGTEGVILLNINSYGGGSKLWHDESDSEDEDSGVDTDDESYSDDGGLYNCLGPSSAHDGLLDVVAVYGTLHLGQMQVGLSKAVRLCQAKSVKIRLMDTLPIQIDGEPWQEAPCEVTISFLQQAFMLSRTVQERDFVTRKVGEVLDWAENTSVITSSQRDVLLAEIARRVADDVENSRGSMTSRQSFTAHHHRREHNLSFFMPSQDH